MHAAGSKGMHKAFLRSFFFRAGRTGTKTSSKKSEAASGYSRLLGEGEETVSAQIHRNLTHRNGTPRDLRSSYAACLASSVICSACCSGDVITFISCQS